MNREFAFKWRVIEPWHEPDGISMFSTAGNIFTWADMLDPQATSALGRYVEQVRDWGFNAMALYCNPETNPAAMRNFARHLKARGIGLFIRRDWREPETGYSWQAAKLGAGLHILRTLCPYSEETRSYWADRIAHDYEMMPELAGYRTSATDFYFANGGPWSCDCKTCSSKTAGERVRDAIRLLAELLDARGGTIFWETCQDDPWGQRHEKQYFRDLTGEIPENAIVLIKRHYWDFHSRWPRHPLYDVITTDARGQSPYATSIQQPGEYRGVHEFPWCMVDEWSGAFKDMVATGQVGIWMMAIVHPDGWDHPLNMVNWSAVAQYMRNPHAEPAELKLAWAQAEFGEEAAPVVVDILDKLTEAARGMYEFDALWTADHSRFPCLVYLDAHMCGPYRQLTRMTGMMGLSLPLDMYEPDEAAAFRTNPQTRMVFNQFPITPQLKAEAMAQKDGAVRLMQEAISLWQSLEDKIDAQKYDKILAGLKGNLNDTIIFRHGMEIYMDWKLGVLTDDKIDAALDACRDLHGIVAPEPLDANPKLLAAPGEAASLKSLAEELRRDLREPWVERYWEKHPIGSGMEAIDWEFRPDE